MSNPWTEPYKEFREETVLSKKDGVEGKLDKVTGKFTPTPFSAEDKERYVKNTSPTAPILPPPSSSGSVAPVSAPILQPKPQRPIPTNASPVTTSTANKIKGGLSNYQSQVKSGDVKGAEETGRSTFALANPKLAAAQAERDRTRGTSQTDNPLMKDIKDRMPMTPSVQSPTLATDLGKGSGNQNLLDNPNASIGAKPKPEMTQATKTKVAFSNPSLLSQTLKKEETVITRYLVSQGYISEKNDLPGNQERIDANKNGKIDSNDFKLLRNGAKKVAKTAGDVVKSTFSGEPGNVGNVTKV